MFGLSGFTSANYARTSGTGGVAWTGSGGADAVLFRVPSQAVLSATRTMYSRRLGLAGRWTRCNGSLATIDAIAISGSSTVITTPARTITAGDVGKIMMVVTWFDGSTLHLTVNRVEAGTGTAMTGHTPDTTSTAVGVRSDTLAEPSTDLQIFGVASLASALNTAQVEAWFDAVKSARAIVACPGVTTGLHQNVNSAGVLAGAGDALPITGSLSLVTEPAPVWGW